MNKLVFERFAGLVMLILVISGCGSNNGPQSMSQSDIVSQIEINKSIADSVGAVFNPNDRPTSYATAKTSLSVRTDVERVDQVSSGIVVHFKSGGSFQWLAPKSPVAPSWYSDVDRSIVITKSISREVVGSKRAVIIDTVYSDPNFPYMQKLTGRIKASLQNQGFTQVDELYDQAASVSAFENLQGYGVIFLITHGSEFPYRDGSKGINIATGELVDSNSNSWAAYRKEESVVPMTYGYGLGDDATRSKPENRHNSWGVTDKFFASRYRNRQFSHSLFINAACEGIRNTTMADALTANGVAAYFGWTESQSTGPFVGYALLSALAGSGNLNDAYSLLVGQGIVQQVNSGDHTVAEFRYSKRPDADTLQTTNVQIANPPQVDVTEPYEGQVLAGTTVTVKGSITCNGYSPTTAFVQANSLQYNITHFVQSGPFEQTVPLVQGPNKVSVIVMSSHGTTIKTVNVNSTQPIQALQTSLTWDTDKTDLDLHLVKPGGQLFSSDSDCYYHDKNPSWTNSDGQAYSVSLDIDVTSGLGPEHIVASGPVESGLFHLYVHYYSTHENANPTTPTLTMRIGNQPPRTYTPPRALVNATSSNVGGDLWDIGEINIKTGDFNLINNVVTNTRAVTRKVLK